MIEALQQKKYLQFILLLIVFVVLCIVVVPSDSNYLWRLPPLLKELPNLIYNSVEYVLFDWWLVDVWDPDIEEYEQKPLMNLFTRAFSGTILFLIEFIREIMLGGVKTIVTFSGWDWATENKWAVWPALPWTVVAAGGTILAYSLNGTRLATFVLFTFCYISIFGQWEPAMQTLSFVLIAAPISVLLGLVMGVWAFRNKRVDMALQPILNVMQIMPHFSYLIPVVVFFGIGDHAGAIATVIFATPPMVRLTILGLKRLSPEIAEAGLMSGCNNKQLLIKVLVPTARRDILIGVNQVIMSCLAMVVLASLIGAKGLGAHLLIALNQLRVGQAIEIGICIVLIAIMLDRLSLAWADKQADYFADKSFVQRHKYWLMFAAAFIVGIILAWIGSLIFKDGFNYLYQVPHKKGITAEVFLQGSVDWIVDEYWRSLKGFSEWLIINVLVPVKTAYLSMPVIATFTLAMGIGYIVGGIRVGLSVGGFLLFIALTEWWDRALITTYLITLSVVFSTVIGIIAGTLCAQNKYATNIMLTVCDTFQTFPSFIYLIPAMMLFGVANDTSVLIAIMVYALVPATRYTIQGLLSVPEELKEAGAMSGVNRIQSYFSIELPLSFPHLALGINQTVVFSLSMVIIGAMIGTDDLGQLILGSLSDKKGVGNGLVLGLCVAFIGLAIDQVLRTWANQRKQALGLA
ncbi:MAG: glycine betaine/proline transport system permease protein [Gammaproteobacteria bacterium]|jgi:glycine betaine/proline transport system permease protein